MGWHKQVLFTSYSKVTITSRKHDEILVSTINTSMFMELALFGSFYMHYVVLLKNRSREAEATLLFEVRLQTFLRSALTTSHPAMCSLFEPLSHTCLSPDPATRPSPITLQVPSINCCEVCDWNHVSALVCLSSAWAPKRIEGSNVSKHEIRGRWMFKKYAKLGFQMVCVLSLWRLTSENSSCTGVGANGWVRSLELEVLG